MTKSTQKTIMALLILMFLGGIAAAKNSKNDENQDIDESTEVTEDATAIEFPRSAITDEKEKGKYDDLPYLVHNGLFSFTRYSDARTGKKVDNKEIAGLLNTFPETKDYVRNAQIYEALYYASLAACLGCTIGSIVSESEKTSRQFNTGSDVSLLSAFVFAQLSGHSETQAVEVYNYMLMQNIDQDG